MIGFILSVLLSGSIDSTTLMIGDQTAMHITAIDTMPVYGEELIPGLEIVDRTAIDTATLPDGRKQYSQTLTLTSFTDSLYYIEDYDLTLNVVQPFVIDSTNAITDIKPIQKAPHWFWGWFRWVLLALLLGLLGTGVAYLVKFVDLRRNGAPLKPKEPERPAEEVALEKLDQIKEAKIWQAGKTKEYHTDLTDVIREYIGRRYAVRSTEKTSDETLHAMKPILSEQKELYTRLQKMLSLADLIKFAKWTATPDENEASLKTAYDFVKATTPSPDSKDDGNDQITNG